MLKKTSGLEAGKIAGQWIIANFKSLKEPRPMRILGAAALMAATILSQNTLAGPPPAFGPPQVIKTTAPVNYLVMGDFNGDGIPDVAIYGSVYNTNDFSSTGITEVRFGNGNNGFSNMVVIFTNTFGRSPPFTGQGVAAGDLNGDGKSELVFAAGNAVLIY